MKRLIMGVCVSAFLLAGCPGDNSDMELDAGAVNCTKQTLGHESEVHELTYQEIEQTSDGTTIKITNMNFTNTKETTGLKTVCETELNAKVIVPDEVLDKFPSLGK